MVVAPPQTGSRDTLFLPTLGKAIPRPWFLPLAMLFVGMALAVHNLANSSRPDAVVAGKLAMTDATSGVASAYLSDLSIVQLGVGMVLPLQVPAPINGTAILPCTAVKDVQEMGVADAVLGCQRANGHALGATALPYGLNRGDRQAVTRSEFPRETNSPSLPIHVGSVVLGSTDEQMIGPNAGRIIALMERPEAVWDGVVVDLPGDVRGSQIPAATIAQQAIPVTLAGSSPDPTGAKIGADDWTILIDFGPKARFYWPRPSQPLDSARGATEPLWRVTDAGERLTARLTCVDGGNASSFQRHHSIPVRMSNHGCLPTSAAMGAGLPVNDAMEMVESPVHVQIGGAADGTLHRAVESANLAMGTGRLDWGRIVTHRDNSSVSRPRTAPTVAGVSCVNFTTTGVLG